MPTPPLPEHNPYAAPQARLDDSLTEDVVMADRGTRLVAKIVDGLAFAGLGIVAAIVLPTMAPEDGSDDPMAMIIFGSVMALAMVAVIVVNCLWLHRYGQTIGKRMMNIKILRVDGSRIGLGRVFGLRWLPISLIGAIPLVGPITSLVDVLMIFRDDRRCLHDLFADSIVVKC